MLIQDASFWKGFIENTGVSASILVAIGVGVWRAAKWLGPRVDSLMDVHIKFVESTGESLEALSQERRKQGEYMVSLDAKMSASHQEVSRLAGAMTENTNVTRQIVSRLDTLIQKMSA